MTADLLAQVTIRHAVRSDLRALEWNGEYSHFRRLYREIFGGVERGETVVWVAELQPVGIIGQMFVALISGRVELADGSERAYIYGFRIKPAFRGQGLGTRMLDEVEGDLARRGYRAVVLNVNQENSEARLLYERLGYRVVAPEPGRWSYTDDLGHVHQVVEPAWRMEKKLNGNG
ncbi:MAG: GNAT family N-acetyltransferase [Chloroflexi bacterium]|nr:GNAT family N-acetyltransferase [Chloroflexota bacterium]